MFIVLEEMDLNLDTVSRVFVRRIGGKPGSEEYAVKVELYAPIVCLRKLRYKEFLVDLYKGSKESCQLFRQALMQLKTHQDQVVTVDHVVQVMKEIKSNKDRLDKNIAAG